MFYIQTDGNPQVALPKSVETVPQAGNEFVSYVISTDTEFVFVKTTS